MKAECVVDEQQIHGTEKEMADLAPAIRENTKILNNLTTNLAISVNWREHFEQRFREVEQKQIKMGQDIAQMEPIVERIQNLVWQAVGAILIGGGTIASAITVIVVKN